MKRIDYIKYELSHGGRENYFLTGRKKDYVGDCAVRACALARTRLYANP